MPAKRSLSKKTKSKEPITRQQTILAHFKTRQRSLSSESEDTPQTLQPPEVNDAAQTVQVEPETLTKLDLEAGSSQTHASGHAKDAASVDDTASLSNEDMVAFTVVDTDGSEPEPLDSNISTCDALQSLPPSSPMTPLSDVPLVLPSDSPEIVFVKLPEPSIQPLHPFFNRAPKPSKPAQDDITPEEVESTSADTKSPSPEVVLREPSIEITLCPPSQTNSLRPGHSYEFPIVVDSLLTKLSAPQNPQPESASKGASTPLQFPNQRAPATKLHPLFASRVTKPRALSPLKSDKRSQLPAPYPNRESQHVRGPQTQFSASSHNFGRRNHTKEDVSPSPGLSILSRNDLQSVESFTGKSHFTLEDRESFLTAIPKDHARSHPSIGRILASLKQDTELSKPSSQSSQTLWSDRWRPTRADEVLGNEQSALYLRDWLSALQLQITSVMPSVAASRADEAATSTGRLFAKAKKSTEARGTKRPRIVRAVDKKKRRKKQRTDWDEDDDWIVSDDFSELDFSYGEQDDEDADIDVSTSRRIYRKDPSPDYTTATPSSQPVYAFDNYLSNTILLTGPPGVGKTAAVYACAEELGWDVFEVYPGIGKRGGTNLDNLIGEVGKSHLVGKTMRRNGDGSVGAEKKPLTGFFGKRNGIPKNTDSEDNKAGPSNLGATSSDFGFVSDAQTEETSGAASVRQSIVLLEEVDILFKEDANFWPAVTNFIRECKRPVICTCNDPSLVPVDDLPLQTTLHFVHPETDVAVSYLQALCCAEGTLVDRQSLAQLYETTYPVDDVDIPDNKVNGAGSIFTQSDIRRAINILQLWLSGNGDPARTAQEVRWGQSYHTLEDLMHSGGRVGSSEAAGSESLRAAFHAEFLSYVDSHLLRDPKDSAEALWHNTTELTNDDEIGHTALVNPSRCLSVHDGLGMYDRDMLIAEDAIRRARGILNTNAIVDQGMFRPRELFRARVEYHSQVVAVLSGGIVPEAVLHRPAGLHVEYGPWVRMMVAADDAQEAYALSQSRGGRSTRNSLGYVRNVRVGSAERDSLLRTGLQVI